MGGRRAWEIDFVRTIALVGMAAYHVIYDVELLQPGAGPDPFSGIWGALPPIVASAFIGIAGISTVLSDGRDRGLRSEGARLVRRAGVLVGAALAVSVVTALVLPDRWVRFGILHLLLVCALITPLVRRSPSWLLIAIAALLIIVRGWPRGLEGSWALLPGGAPPAEIRMADYWPIIPWVSPFLVGVAVGRAVYGRATASRGGPPLIRVQGPEWLAAPGRHSLLFYLAHQWVILVALLLLLLAIGRSPVLP